MSLDIPLQAHCIPKLEVILGGWRPDIGITDADGSEPHHAQIACSFTGIAASWIEYFEVPHEFARADR